MEIRMPELMELVFCILLFPSKRVEIEEGRRREGLDSSKFSSSVLLVALVKPSKAQLSHRLMGKEAGGEGDKDTGLSLCLHLVISLPLSLPLHKVQE